MSDNTANNTETRREDWVTPRDLFDKLDSIFRFGIDLCASHENRKCPTYIDEKMDIFSDKARQFVNSKTRWWYGYAWQNPPYKRNGGTAPYIERAVELAKAKGLVCLIPTATGNQWWSKHVWPNFDFMVFPRRFGFEGAGNNAKFDCTICVKIDEMNAAAERLRVASAIKMSGIGALVEIR